LISLPLRFTPPSYTFHIRRYFADETLCRHAMLMPRDAD